MPKKLVCGMIVHNEKDRYLGRVIENNLKFCDEIVILDDRSTDGSAEFCRTFGPRVIVHAAVNSWEEEWRLREELIRHLLERNPDYVIIIDADELYEETLVQEAPILMNRNVPVMKFIFHDMWNTEDTYRNDAYFQVFAGARMCRADLLNKEYQWAESRRHCGSLPVSILKNRAYKARSRVKHMGYANPEHRKRKYQEKVSDDPKNQFYPKTVYDEILNDSPQLYRFMPHNRFFLGCLFSWQRFLNTIPFLRG